MTGVPPGLSSTPTELTGSADPTHESSEKSADASPESSKKNEHQDFLERMERLQAEANANTLMTSQLSNEKTLNDAHAKIIRGGGESIKEMAPR